MLTAAGAPMTERDAARRAGLDVRSAQLALDDLVPLGLVRLDEAGRAHLVRFNPAHHLAPAVDQLFRRECRTDRTRRVEPARADGYAEIGRRLLLAGRTMAAQGDPAHASALAILAVHATIAFTDASCIRFGGKKSASSDRSAAVGLLRATLRERLPAAIARAVLRVVGRNDRVEYEGYVVRSTEAGRLFEHAERVGAWAEALLHEPTAP